MHFINSRRLGIFTTNLGKTLHLRIGGWANPSVKLTWFQFVLVVGIASFIREYSVKYCTMTVTHCGPYEDEMYPCEVVISNAKIAVSYSDGEGGYTVYQGMDSGHGHFNLKLVNKDGDGGKVGNATLHRVYGYPDELEGSWFEDGARGYWRITQDD